MRDGQTSSSSRVRYDARKWVRERRAPVRNVVGASGFVAIDFGQADVLLDSLVRAVPPMGDLTDR
jgi:hypothetical protein